MPGQPAVSVLLATWNDLRFLPEAAASILGQTFADFEFVIVDDGSTDQTAAYLQSLDDPRVQTLRISYNSGLAAALNAGLDECRGNFIARMDADDIAEPDRLRRQIEFMEANQDIGIVGSSRMLIDEQNALIAPAPAMTDDLSIRWKCLLGNPLAHPTVMLRRDILDRQALRYDPTYRSAQDYELWTRLLPLTRAANLPEPLLRYRVRPTSISRSRRAEQVANHDRIALQANRQLLPNFPLTAEQITNLRGRYGGKSVRDESMDPADPSWLGLLEDMLSAFAERYSSHPELEACVRRQVQWMTGFHLTFSDPPIPRPSTVREIQARRPTRPGGRSSRQGDDQSLRRQ